MAGSGIRRVHFPGYRQDFGDVITLKAWLDQLFPFFMDRDCVRKIRVRRRAQHKMITRGEGLDATWEKYRPLPKKEIEQSLKAELKRQKLMHERARTFLGSLAVMSAFTIGALGWFDGSGAGSIARWMIALGIMFTLVSLAGGAWFALQIVMPDDLYHLTLQNRMPGESPPSEEERSDFMLQLIQLNQAQNLVLASYSARSYRCMRNALVGMLVVLMLLLLSTVAS